MPEHCSHLRKTNPMHLAEMQIGSNCLPRSMSRHIQTHSSSRPRCVASRACSNPLEHASGSKDGGCTRPSSQAGPGSLSRREALAAGAASELSSTPGASGGAAAAIATTALAPDLSVSQVGYAMLFSWMQSH